MKLKRKTGVRSRKFDNARLSITLDPDQKEWLHRQCILLGDGVSVAEVIRQLIDERGGVDMRKPRPELLEDLSGPPDFKAMPKSKRTFLKSLEHHFTPQAAAAAMGLKLAKAAAWLQDEAFYTEAQQAQQATIALAESKLLAIGMGKDRGGDRAALEAVLEARHPKYGRVKAEIVRRCLRQWVGGVLNILTELLGDTDSGRATLKALGERIAEHEAAGTKGFTD